MCEKCNDTKCGQIYYKYYVDLKNKTIRRVKCTIDNIYPRYFSFTEIDEQTGEERTRSCNHIYDGCVCYSGKYATVFLKKANKTRALKLIDKFFEQKVSEHQTVANAYEAKRDILKNL